MRGPDNIPAPLRAGDNGAPRGNWGGPPPSAQPQRADRGVGPGSGMWRGPPPSAQPQPQRADRGVWPGSGMWRGDRGRPDGYRADMRPTPPQANLAIQDRDQWRRDHRDARGDDRRWDDRDRGQWTGGDNRRDYDGRRWDNDGRRWSGGDRRVDADRRWGGTDRRWAGGDRHWDPGRWRNDYRYDWRRWRSGHRDLFRSRYYAPRGYHYRSVYVGFYLEPFFYGSSYWLADPYMYRLPPVDWPLRWVRYYDDALLVDVTTGEVLDVIPNFFW
jgi:hypothetical protein